MISPKLIAAGVVAVLVISSLAYVAHLRSTIEDQRIELEANSALIRTQRESIKAITEEQASFAARLKEAQKQSVIIRDRVITKLKSVPAAPSQCEPAMNWLIDRAQELSKESRR